MPTQRSTLGILVRLLAGLLFLTSCSNAATTATQVAMRCNAILPYIEQGAAACSKVGRDQVCYGSRTVDVQFSDGSSSDSLSFVKPGDIVPLTAFKTIHTSRIDLDQGQVGLALFKLQAQMPNTTTGQAVTFALYGDSTFGQQNTGQSISEAENTASNKIGTFPNGGAFYFATNVAANANCTDISPGGLIVKNQKGTQVTFNLNGAQVTIGSTVLFQIDRNSQMVVSVMEGHAEVTANGSTQVAQAGQQLSVSVNNGTIPQVSSAPSKPIQIPKSYQFLNCGLARTAGIRTDCVILSADFGTSQSSQSSSQNGASDVLDQACQIMQFGVAQNPAPLLDGKFCTNLTWSTQGGAVSIDGAGAGSSGSKQVCIHDTTTFTLKLECNNGTRSTNLTLNPAGNLLNPNR